MARTTAYRRGDTIFTQGDASADVLYIEAGRVRLTVASRTGREAVLAMLGPGDFFGEGCLAGQERRIGSATAAARSVIRVVAQDAMRERLQRQPAMAGRFLAHLLAHHVRLEEDLIDQLFYGS